MLAMKIYTYFKGQLVGEDEFGNKYYRKKNSPQENKREKRWVMYNGQPEASKVPAEWHGWLHHTFDLPVDVANIRKWPWQKIHLPNLTGTDLSYRPPGHTLRGKKRDQATGDYQPWTPQS